MANIDEGDYGAGIYVKGDRTRIANTKADAVQAVWDGYAPQGGDSDYRALQAKAKDLGIPANQSAEALTEAIAQHS